MSNLARKLLGTTSDSALDIADAFSTDLYTGNGGTQTITNGVDVSTEGGMVWIKSRSAATDHQLFDTERGATKELISNSTAAEATDADTLTAFNSTGFSIGADANVNTSAATYAAWTFRKAPKFFDVVTYTGDGTASRAIPHNLGVEPGMIVVKRLDFTANWGVYHKELAQAEFLLLNTQNVVLSRATYEEFDKANTTDAYFTIGDSGTVNASGGTYVAYLFAHDIEDTGVIQCGGYTGNGSTSGPTITLGWEPQWLLIKRASGGDGHWVLLDSARSNFSQYITASQSAAEFSFSPLSVSPTGFTLTSADNGTNASGSEYIYMAIRAEGA